MINGYRVAFIEPGNFPYGFGHKSVYTGVLMPRAAPALGALAIQAGYEFKAWSGELGPINPNEIAEWAQVVCISVMSNSASYGLMLAHRFHELGLTVLMGGYHFAQNTLTDDTLRQTVEAFAFGADYVVRGEGYTSLIPLLNHITSRQAGDAELHEQMLQGINGLSWRRRDGQLVHNRADRLVTPLQEMPTADWSVIENAQNLRTLGPHGVSGCPRECSFCAVRTRDGNGRNRNTPQKLVDEIEQALAVLPQIKHIFFSDDNIVVFHDWLRELCQELITRGINLPWSCQAEIPTLVKQPDLPAVMAKAGCVRACLGFETLNGQALQGTVKRQSIADMELAVKRLHDAGIAVHGMFIVGLSGDRQLDIEQTWTWALEHNVETAQFLCLIDLPGSVDYESLELWSNSYRPLSGPYEPLNWALLNGHYARRQSAELSLNEVQNLSLNMMRRFYSLGRLFGRLLKPRFDVWRARRSQGFGYWRATRAMLGHQAIAFALGWRGYTNIRAWLDTDLNQAYLQALQARNRDEENRAIKQILKGFPAEWLAICEQVAATQK